MMGLHYGQQSSESEQQEQEIFVRRRGFFDIEARCFFRVASSF